MSRLLELQESDLHNRISRLESYVQDLKIGRQFTSQSSGVRYYTNGSESTPTPIRYSSNGGASYTSGSGIRFKKVTPKPNFVGASFEIDYYFFPNTHRPAVAMMTNIMKVPLFNVRYVFGSNQYIYYVKNGINIESWEKEGEVTLSVDDSLIKTTHNLQLSFGAQDTPADFDMLFYALSRASDRGLARVDIRLVSSNNPIEVIP